MAEATKIFSKSLTDTDIKKRLAIPAKILPSLPHFNVSNAVTIQLLYGTRKWPIVCSIRKKGYKKPVFSGGWRKFVVCNNFNVGDELTLYNEQDEVGSFHYRVQVEKLARSSGDPSTRSFSLSHKVDESTGTSRTKACNFQNELQRLIEANAPVKQEEAIRELADVVADEPVAFVDHVMAKPASRIFGTNVSDEATRKAHFKTEQESKMKFFGITKNTFMGDPPLHSYYMTNEEREIKSCALAEDGAMAYGITQVVGDAYKSHSKKLNLDFIPRLPNPYAAEVNLDLTLAPPGVEMEAPGLFDN